MTIGVIDYGLGNIRSVENALVSVGCVSRRVASASQLDDLDGIILPGVGAFGDGIRRLRHGELADAIVERVETGTPLLGLCLGMQLLATVSYEFGEHRGLNLIPGEVCRIEPGPGHRIPHMGWNEVSPRGGDLLSGLESPTFYFVHSFAMTPTDEAVVTGTTDYGVPIVACVERGVVRGAQFHPEKSHDDGRQLLRNFAGLCGASVLAPC